MKRKLTAEEWWDDILEYERTHPIAFASTSALREARLIAELERVKQNRRRHRRTQQKGVAHRRKTVAG